MLETASWLSAGTFLFLFMLSCTKPKRAPPGNPCLDYYHKARLIYIVNPYDVDLKKTFMMYAYGILNHTGVSNFHRNKLPLPHVFNRVETG